jgi:small subunit ribosomal protein S1
MAGHHVDLPEQVVTPGEELWVKIIDIDLQRRRISLSIKQAAEGGEVSEEYREAFGEHAYDDEGNYVGPVFAEAEFTPETEAQAAWADYVAEHGTGEGAEGEAVAAVAEGEAAAAAGPAAGETPSSEAPSAEAPSAEAPSAEAPAAEAAPTEAPVAEPTAPEAVPAPTEA